VELRSASWTWVSRARHFCSAGTELALELGDGARRTGRSSEPAKQAPAALKVKDKSGRVALLLLLLAVVGAWAVVPYLFGYGPFAMRLFTGSGEDEEETAGPGPGPGPSGPTVQADGGSAPVATATDGGSAEEATDAASSPWGDMPPVNEKFLAQPDTVVDGVPLEDYLASGEALLRMQDQGYLTKKRFEVLCGVQGLNALVPLGPREVLSRLRELAGLAFDHALARGPYSAAAMAGSGRVKLLKGDVEGAIYAFERAVGQEPGNAEYLFGQVEAVLSLSTNERLSRAEKILALLEPIAANDPRLDVYWGDLQLAYLDQGLAEERYRKAVARVRESRGLPPPPCAGDACPDVADAPDAPDEAAAPAGVTIDDRTVELVYGRLVDFYGRIALQRQSGELSDSPAFPDEPAAYLAKADQARLDGRALLAQPVSIDARFGVVLARFGMTTRDLPVLEQARQVLEQVQDEAQALLVVPLDPLFYLGLIYKQNKDLDKAREVFDRIYAQDDSYPGVFMMQVQLSYSPEILREQLPANLERLKADPESQELLLRVAVSAFYADQLDLAEETFKKILATNPDSPDANHYLGRIYFQRGQNVEARTYLLKAIEKTVTPVASYYLYLGWLYETEGSFSDAVTQLKLAKTLDDTAWEAYWRLGEIYTRLRVSDPDDSPLGLLTRAAELNPESAEVQASLGRYHEMYGDPATAVEHYRKALALVDAGHEMKPAEIGSACTALGKLLQPDDPRQAEEVFRRALTVGVQLEDALREKEQRPTTLYTARWYWEAAYRLAGILRDARQLPEAATYYLWALPYVPGQPEETNARRALAVIQQVVPAGDIIDPSQARIAAEPPSPTPTP
jgi:tetratricopeptide (TPR) repeat protein